MHRSLYYLFAFIVLVGTAEAQASQDIWREVDAGLRQSESGARYFTADYQRLQRLLELSPAEHSGDRSNIIPIPMPDGSFADFAIVESPIMEPELAARYPQIKNYKAHGVDDPGASGRLSYNPKGFGGMLHTSQGRFFIDPDGSSGRYVLRSRPDAGSSPLRCDAYHPEANNRSSTEFPVQSSNRVPGSYLTYRLAVATTLEYYNIVGGTAPATTLEINTAINRVNEIYERDLGIRLLLIANNNLLYETIDMGLLDNDSGLNLLGQVQPWIDGLLPGGIADYDIGHIFSTGGGGVARLGAVCDNLIKAQGVTGLPNPTGDPFYIDFVAHEIGHQFNGDHTFNGSTLNCGGFNRNASTAFEPGSGSTIMAYAGICSLENIQLQSDATFHAGSINQINAFVGGETCDALLANGNADPTLTAIVDRSIPVATPFVLDNTTAMDIDVGDVLSYQWDQMDAGTATTATTLGTDLGDNALFRSYAPRSESFRNFPALGTQVNNGFDDAEVLACTTRNLDFRLTVRDDMSGQVTDDVTVTVDDTSGPFRVTSHTTAQAIVPNSGAVTVTWDVANTNAAPVSCANVDIELLTFSAGHAAYSVQTLVGGANTPNDGSQLVTISDISNAISRFRVKCSNSIFYDVSDADLSITGTNQIVVYDNPVFFNNTNGTIGSTDPCQIVVVGGGGGADDTPHDSGAFNPLWLLIMTGLIAAFRRLRNQR